MGESEFRRMEGVREIAVLRERQGFALSPLRVTFLNSIIDWMALSLL